MRNTSIDCLKLNVKLAIFISCLLSFFWCLVTFAGEMHGLRGQRYCEILLGPKSGPPTRVQVYNTIGLNDCPDKLWKKITPDLITQETGSSFVHLNGPRYWVIDGFENTALISPTTRTFGGIAMRDAGVLHLGFLEILRGQKPYTRHPVKRQTTWIYLSGKPIYEITDAKGQKYVMQSYSVQTTEQTLESLTHLADKLHLPAGWHFQTRVLKRDAHLTPIKEKAVVVQDDFLNTYQQETPDFIAESPE